MHSKQVRSLEEELSEIGLNPEQTIGQIQRTTSLIEQRMGGGPGNGGGAPVYTQPQERPQPSPGSTPAEQMDEGEEIEEAVKLKRVKRKTAGEKLMSRRQYRKMRSKAKMAGKQYRQRHKRQIARRRAILKKKFGAGPRRKGFRVVRESEEEISLDQLREDINGSVAATSSDMNPFCEAALNAGMLAMHYGEMFEALGDEETAERLFAQSDIAADLANQFASLGEDDELDQDSENRLSSVLEHVTKGMRFHEALGCPTLVKLIEAVEICGDELQEKGMDAVLKALAASEKKKGKSKNKDGKKKGGYNPFKAHGM